MALSDLQKLVVGMFSPPQAPAGASIYDQARADAQRQALAQLGMGLVGAAVPQTATMRAQALQQAFGGLGNVGTNIYNSAQARLMAQQAESAANKDKILAERANAILGGLQPAALTVSNTPIVAPVAPIDTGSSTVPAQGMVPLTPQPAATPAPSPSPTAQEPSSKPIQLTEADRIRLQNAAALGDEEVIKVYNDIVKEKTAPSKSEYLGMQVMRMPDGKYAYVQPSKTGGPPIVLGPAPAPGEEEKAIIVAKSQGDILAFQPKATAAVARTENNAANVILATKGALEILRRNPQWTTGKTGKALESVPGTDAYQLAQYLKTIKANVGFNELQQMREASPTGGALGQVAVQELESLQSTKGSLDVGQNADALTKSLLNIAADTDSTVTSLYDAYERDYGKSPFARGTVYDMSGIYMAPESAVTLLRNNADNPEARKAFDMQFGKGAAKFYLGVTNGR